MCVANPYYNTDIGGINNNWNCVPAYGTSLVSQSMTFGGRYFTSIANCLGTIGTSSTCYNYAVMVASYNSTIGNIANTAMYGLQSCTASAANSTYMDAFTKVVGSFSIDHPDPEKCGIYLLNHNFVEAPSAGENLYRFEVSTNNCEAVVSLPSYYKFLNKDTITKVSPVNNLGTGYVILDDNLETFTLKTNCDGIFNILLIGTRKDPDAVRSWMGVEPYNNYEGNYLGSKV